ncbi:MAG: hypothetical protein AAFQ43_08900, partial [Bacteroidota bacterium]
MRRLLALAAVASAALVLAAGPAHAQEGGLPPGQPMMSLPSASWLEAELTTSAPVLGDSSFVNEYMLTSDGSPFEVRLLSSVFDTYLQLISPSGQVYGNDDYNNAWGESRLVIPTDSAEAGTWLVQANSYLAGETGPYSLAHRPLGPLAPGAQPVGGWIGGALTSETPLLRDSTHVQEIEIVSDGAPFEVRLTSFDFDPYLIVTSPSGTRYDNDDYGSIRESRVIVPPDSAEAGTWEVWVNTF